MFRLPILFTSLLAVTSAYSALEIDLRRHEATYLKNKFSLPSDKNKTKIEIIRVDTDFNGTTHTRIKQTYEGIPVWKAEAVIHKPKTFALHRLDKTTMDGLIYEDLDQDLKHLPAFAKNASKQASQNVKKLLKTSSANLIFKNTHSSPIIFIDKSKKAHKAFLVSLTYRHPKEQKQMIAIIDALTQKIYFTLSDNHALPFQVKAESSHKNKPFQKIIDDIHLKKGLYAVSAGGIGGNPKLGEIIYDGNSKHHPSLNITAIDIDRKNASNEKETICFLMNNDITLFDNRRNDEIVHGKCIKHKLHNNIYWLSLNNNNTRWYKDEANGGYSPSLDAFYGIMVAKNMFQDWFQVSPIIEKNGQPTKYLISLHGDFDNATFNPPNSLWLGDGINAYYPLVAPEVIAHELAHLFMHNYSDLDGSSSLQMAALVESFGDMTAMAVQYYLTGKNRWAVLEEVAKPEMANQAGIRYLDNPLKDGTSIDHMKHFSEVKGRYEIAGISNKAFFLLATTKGWNTRKAYEVMAKANMHYWTANLSTFNEAACGVISATKDYGYRVADVVTAFKQVGIETTECL